MIAAPSGAPVPGRTGLVAIAVVLGLASGLVEGVVHMAVQRIFLQNSWYPIIWIASAVNALLLLILALGWLALERVVPALTRARGAAVFGLVFAACLPVLALGAREWLYPYAIVLLAAGLGVAATRRFARNPAAATAAFRRRLPLVAGLAVLAFVGIEGGAMLRERVLTARLPAADAGTPDVLLVVIDTLRADHLSSHGYHRATSPTLDRLANEGVLFERAIAASSYTLPSHASLLSGLPPSEHGVLWETSKDPRPEAYVPLPARLQARGYRTAAFSANQFWFSREHGFGEGFIRFEDYFHSTADRVLRTAYGSMAVRFLYPRLGWRDIPARKRATDTNRALLEWVADGADRPWLAVVNYMDVHDPYLPPEPYRSRFASRPSPGGLINWRLHIPKTLTPDELQSEIDAYDGAITYVDAQFGALLDALQSAQPDRPRLVIVTSDHGEEFGEHGGFLHGNHLYRETIDVPLIVWLPGVVPAGRRVATPVTNASVVATILDLVGVSAESSLAPSLLPLWDRQEPVDAWPLPLAELEHRPWAEESSPVREGAMRTLMSRRWQYIDHDRRPPELYDLVADPRARHDVARDPEAVGELARFAELLARRGAR